MPNTEPAAEASRQTHPLGELVLKVLGNSEKVSKATFQTFEVCEIDW